MNKKFNIGGNCAPKMSQVWDKIKRIVKTMENRWTKKETLRPADEQKTETHLLEQLGSLGLLLLLLPSLALPQLRSCDRRDKIRNQGAIHPTVTLKKKKKHFTYSFISLSLFYTVLHFSGFILLTVYSLQGKFSPLSWSTHSLTTDADIAILTLFKFIFQHVKNGQECEVWCNWKQQQYSKQNEVVLYWYWSKPHFDY